MKLARGKTAPYTPRDVTLKIAVPNKGRLAAQAADILSRAGIPGAPDESRSLIHTAPGGAYTIIYSRAQDIPEYVDTAAADIGITGLDLVEELDCTVEKLLDLDFGRCRLVVAAPDRGRVATLDDVGNNARVATAFPNLTKRFFDERKKKIRVVPITGAAEIAPQIGVADLITDLVETGTTLRQNHLTLVDVIMNSWAVLIAHPEARKKHGDEIDRVVEGLRSVMAAHRKRYLMANVPKKALPKIAKVLPGLSGPTVMPLAGKTMVAVHAVVDDDKLNRTIHDLKKIGASGILVLPIERLVP